MPTFDEVSGQHEALVLVCSREDDGGDARLDDAPLRSAFAPVDAPPHFG